MRMLLSKKDLANELRLSVRKLDDMNCRGLLPAPRRLGRSVRWVRDEIQLWVQLGCPSRERFDEEKGRDG